jgi:hypothetical protein
MGAEPLAAGAVAGAARPSTRAPARLWLQPSQGRSRGPYVRQSELFDAGKRRNGRSPPRTPSLTFPPITPLQRSAERESGRRYRNRQPGSPNPRQSRGRAAWVPACGSNAGWSVLSRAPCRPNRAWLSGWPGCRPMVQQAPQAIASRADCERLSRASKAVPRFGFEASKRGKACSPSIYWRLSCMLNAAQIHLHF